MLNKWRRNAVAQRFSLLLGPSVSDPDGKGGDSAPLSLRDILGRLILIRVLILSVILGFAGYQLIYQHDTSQSSTSLFWTIAITYGVSLLNALALRHVQSLRTFAYIQLGIDVLLATMAISVTNSLGAIVLYLLIIVAGAIVCGQHGAVILAAVSGLSYSILAAGLIPFVGVQIASPSTQDILVVYMSMIVIALVSGYLMRQLEVMGSLADSKARTLVHLSSQQQRLFDEMSEGIIAVDLQSSITAINQAARAILGLSQMDAEHFIGQSLPKLLREQGVNDADRLLSGKSGANGDSEITLLRAKTNEEVLLDYSIRPLSDETGNESGRIVIFNDVSRVRSMEERLKLHEQMTKLLADTTPNGHLADSTLSYREITGESPVMQRVFGLVERVAASEASVLINGESGTGKELIAKAIHAQGSRRNQAFVAINCGAIPDTLIESELFGHKKGAYTGAISDGLGLFRQAHNGTIFLDEIGELSPQMQTKLLRVLQEKTLRPVGEVRDVTVDVRVIAATNRDLKKEIAAGRFREDLYYRLNVVNIIVPPLRDRREDIPLLVRHFIGRLCDQDKPLPQVSSEALQLLMSYAYPGNIRELENIIERALVLGGSAILPDHLPEEVLSAVRRDGLGRDGLGRNSSDVLSGLSKPETEVIVLPIDLERELAELERHYLVLALEQSGGVKKHAAELLGLNFRSFRYRLKKYGFGDLGADEKDHS